MRFAERQIMETLFEFNRLYDREAPLIEALPDLASKFPDRHGSLTLRQLSDEMHAAMKQLSLPAPLRKRATLSQNR